MNKQLIMLTFGALTAALHTSAQATTFYEEEFVCPIGGEKFKANVVMSNSSWGNRPDGKPYSPLPVYPVVECPDNGFLMFDEDLTEEELRILESAIATPEFQEMRDKDTQHYRVWWLKEKVNRSDISQLSSLLQASWETDHDYDRKVKYQSKFANLALSMEPSDENGASWFYYNIRAVNVLRELGYFAEGLKRLDYLMQSKHLPQDPETQEDVRFFAGELKALLEQENPFLEPANLVPPETAMFRCTVPKSPLTAAEIAACSSEKVIAATEEFEYKTHRGQKLKGKAAVEAADRERRSAQHSH